MRFSDAERVVFRAVVLLVFCGAAFGGWSGGAWMPELNVLGGDEALCPRLSGDGLTMYFVRHIPAFGHRAVVEAYRSSPAGMFTSEKLLSELRFSGDDISGPWVSQDGLRLYYDETIFGGKMIKMAQRADTASDWVPVRTFTELHTGSASGSIASLSGDELTIIWQSSTRVGTVGGVDLWMATRSSISEAFSNIRPLYELNSAGDDQSACLLPDGLTLYFVSRDRDGNSGRSIYRTTRSSVGGVFGPAQLVQLPDTQSVEEEYVFVASDEETLFYSVSGQGVFGSYWSELAGTYHVDVYRGDDGNDGLSKDNAFATIQRGIDIADEGSTVLLWPGVYNEQVDFKGKAITVKSAADAAVVRAIAGYAFTFRSGEGAKSVLKNFVISDSEYGIYLTNGSSPTISNLTIVNNDYGISAYDGSSPDISNCIVWGNSYGDLFGCEATYSCVQDGSEGEGNIHTFPLFADLAGGDYHLKSERGRYVPLDPNLPPWTEPVHLAELDDGANIATYHSISADGLTMYVERHIPSLGHRCIVEAYRSAAEGPFTAERVLDELADGYAVGSPWISQDGLRLYYHEPTASGSVRIKMAHRNNAGEIWTPTKIFEELSVDDAIAGSPGLSGDELVIVFHTNRPGGAGSIDMWMADRQSMDEPFGNLRPLYELNSVVSDVCPHVMPDGLKLYFISSRNSSTLDIYKATRSSRNDIFGEPVLIDLPDRNSTRYEGVRVAPDERTIYYYRNSYGVYVTQFVDGQWVLDKSTSFCVDAGNPVINPDGEREPNGGRVNIGAYGGTSSASMSEWGVRGDINRDGTVDVADLLKIAESWLEVFPWKQ